MHHTINLHRRHLTTSQAAMCAQRAREMYDRAAKERQSKGGGDKKSGKENSPDPIENTGQSRDQVGEAFGVSGYSVDRAKKVINDGITDLAEAGSLRAGNEKGFTHEW